MTQAISGYSYWALAALGLIAIGCEAGGVGDPCIPEDEYQLFFSNYGQEDVFRELGSFQCETRLCLVNHFQGRVSCPYGQKDPHDPANRNKGGEDSDLCRIPGTSGTAPATLPDVVISDDVVQVPVRAQLVVRRPEDTVYCSCRCKNADGATDDGGRYCECPSGYDCEKLVDNLGLGQAEAAGYYCIQQGTKYTRRFETECSADFTAEECGNEGRNP